MREVTRRPDADVAVIDEPREAHLPAEAVELRRIARQPPQQQHRQRGPHVLWLSTASWSKVWNHHSKTSARDEARSLPTSSLPSCRLLKPCVRCWPAARQDDLPRLAGAAAGPTCTRA